MPDLLQPDSVVNAQSDLEKAAEPQAEAPAEVSSVEADRQEIEREEAREFLEQPGEELEAAMEAQPAVAAASSSAQAGAKPAPVQEAPVKDEVTISIEKALEEKLGDVYATLPEELKPAFRAKGESISSEIAEMVRTLKFSAERVLRLIKEWLHMIPKANKFYLEQEAKIKTDKIIELVEARKNDLSPKP